jgi:hypothetical protein
MTNKEEVLKRYGLPPGNYSLAEISRFSDIPLEILTAVYRRGLGAYGSNLKSVRLKGSYVKNVDAPRSAKLSAPQWAAGRVWSFVNGSPKGHDEDLRENIPK